VLGFRNVSLPEITLQQCPPGHWCTAGATINCTVGTWNGAPSGYLATACDECPSHSTTRHEASTSIEQCLCEAGWYNSNRSVGAVSCERCFIGTECATDEIGLSLHALPIARGYYRPTSWSIDVRRCPDAGQGCPGGQSVCAMTTSGCQGGTDFGTMCRRDADNTWTLSGVYCRLCDPLNTTDTLYYSAATHDDPASCKPCRDTLGRSLGVITGVLVGLFILAVGGYYCCTRHLPTRRKQQLRFAYMRFTLHIKVKILVSFYMIFTQVDNVYRGRSPSASILDSRRHRSRVWA